MKAALVACALFSAGVHGFARMNEDPVLCEGNDAEDYCDCSSDCGSSFCACADAIACCEDKKEDGPPSCVLDCPNFQSITDM
jgi:hypothetical protein